MSSIFAVICQRWQEYERGWGNQLFGYTIHVDQRALAAYLVDFYSDRPSTAPDWYVQEYDLPFMVEVSEEVYNKLVAKTNKSNWYNLPTGTTNV